MPSIVYHVSRWRILLEEEGEALFRIRCLGPGEALPACAIGDTPLLREACLQLDAYFSGRLQRFDLSVVAKGTAFQQKVWEALRGIDYGAVKSYGDIAREIGSPRAFRAVGMACGRNPVLFVIPCHRVVGAGGLGGFACGLELKKYLLELEKAFLI